MMSTRQAPERPVRVMCADDHHLMRAGIAGMIQGQPDLELVGEAEDGAQAVERFRLLRPDVTLMDLQMPVMGGVEAIAAIREEFPLARIIVLTTFSGDVLAQRGLKAGAQAYVLKCKVRRELLDIIRAVHAGRRWISADVAMTIAQHAATQPLTEREVQVLESIAGGNGNKTVADALSITEGTVKSHVKNILEKLEARDRTHAVTLGLRRGIISLAD